jgi:hypothetical protein
LDIAAQYFPEDDPRVIKIESGDNVGVKTFHGGLVPSPLDIWLEDTNPLGWTATGRIEQAQDLYKSGLITDPNQILEMLKLNNADPAFQFEHINRQTARKENESLNKGEFVPVESEDYDPIHIEEHVKEMVSYSFKTKPDPVKQAFNEHMAEHKQRAAQYAQPPQQGQPGGGNEMTPPKPQNASMEELLQRSR